MEILFNYVWMLIILVTILNISILKKRVTKYIEEKPEREKGYDLIFKNYLIYGLIPFIIMGIGSITGQTKSIFDYFQPAKLNPFVLLFHLSVIITWLMMIWFIFFKNGAQFLEEHPGLVHFKSPGYYNDRLSAKSIKIFTVLALAGGAIGMILMWNINFNIPF